MIVRAATDADIAAIATIYGHHVLTGLGTFEEIPPTREDMAARVAALRALDLPYLVAADGASLAGFAYASPFRPRAAYRFTVEDSVYVAPAAIGQGVGRRLLTEVIGACEAKGMRQLMAVIGDSANAASIGLHRALGFQDAGQVRAVGFKHGRWVDIVLMQRALNTRDTSLPRG